MSQKSESSPTFSWKRLILLLGTTLFALWLILLAGTGIFPEFFLFPKIPPTYSREEPGFSRLVYDETGSELSTLYLCHPESEYILLYSHGSAVDLGDMRPLLYQHFLALKLSVFSYDYPGYGQSDGASSESACYAAINAVYDHLVNDLNIPPEKIIAYGRSLGSGPTIDLATREKLGGIIVTSAFTDSYRVMTRIPLLPWQPFNNRKKIRKIRCPVLFIHGADDKTVPLSQAKTLFELAPEPKFAFWAKNAGHKQLLEKSGESYLLAIRDFLNIREIPDNP